MLKERKLPSFPPSFALFPGAIEADNANNIWRTDGPRTDVHFFAGRSLCSFPPSFPHRNFDRQLCSSIRREEEREKERTQASGQIGFAGQGSVGPRNKREGERGRNSILISDESRFAKLSTNTRFSPSVRPKCWQQLRLVLSILRSHSLQRRWWRWSICK